MVDRRKKIEMVLAMFDDEDIPYINPKLKFKMITYNKEVNVSEKQKVKRVGVYNDRRRK